MQTNNKNGNIAIIFNEEEALVLLEWLHNFNQEEHSTLFQDQAEKRILFDIEAELEKAKIYFIIRDFETAKLKEHEETLEQIVKQIMINYPASNYTFSVSEQYRNMKEVLINHPEVAHYAELAMIEAGITPNKGLIRGGTDGSKLSFMGLPCPNLFAGEHAIHSKKEWVSEQDMQKAAEVIIRICQLCERNA